MLGCSLHGATVAVKPGSHAVLAWLFKSALKHAFGLLVGSCVCIETDLATDAILL
jgi:hypothetical protein